MSALSPDWSGLAVLFVMFVFVRFVRLFFVSGGFVSVSCFVVFMLFSCFVIVKM